MMGAWFRAFAEAAQGVIQRPRVCRILCPFHREQTPSCMVHLDRREYVCFGCGREGPVSDIPDNCLPDTLRAELQR